MRVKVKNFKSVGEVELTLSPVTIFVGPPGGGKSNIMEAIAFAGYFARFVRNTHGSEKLAQLLRCHSYRPSCLMPYGNAELQLLVELDSETGSRTLVTLDGESQLSVNGLKLPWPPRDVSEQLKGLENAVEARLYGYDRYSLASFDTRSLAWQMAGDLGQPFPKSVLSENGANIKSITWATRKVAADLNALLEEVGIEVKVLQTGALAFFDHNYQVNPFVVPDSLYRAVYYLTAMLSSAEYGKAYGNYVAILEAPDAKMPANFYKLLADYIASASESVYVVVEAHNPLFVSALWDRAKGAKTYYVARGKDGLTSVWEIDVGKLAKEVLTAEDLFYMRPQEVVMNFAI